MATDLFNNNANNYANPGFAPCVGDPDSNFLVFLEEGVGIISGSDTLSKIDFKNLKIPVSAWSQQTRVVQPLEVVYIQGLTKILLSRQQAFSLPSLSSSDSTLDKFFMQVDLSINYLSGFATVASDVDASANYGTSVAIDDALTLEFFNQSIGVTSTIDTNHLFFNGTTDGEDFEITNVVLTLIDASIDSDSPFTPTIINGERVPIQYVLGRDQSLEVQAAKHANTASQGIVLKNVYPSEYNSTTISEYDKWVYLNHVPEQVVTYTPVDLRFLIDSSTDFRVVFDGSTFLGVSAPVFTTDISIADVSIVGDVSVGDASIVRRTGVSLYSDGSIFDNTIQNSVELTDASISLSYVLFSNVIDSFTLTDSSISDTVVDTSDGSTKIVMNNIYSTYSFIKDASITTAIILDSSVFDSSVGDASINSSYFNRASIENSDTTGTRIRHTDVDGGTHPSLNAEGQYPTLTSTLSSLRLSQAAQVFSYVMTDVSVDAGVSVTSITDSSIDRFDVISLTGDINVVLDNVSIADASITESQITNSNVYRATIQNSYTNYTNVWTSYVTDASMRRTVLRDSSVDNVFLQDSSIYNVIVSDSRLVEGTGALENVDASTANISGASIQGGLMENVDVYDSSIYGAVINRDSSISNSIVENSWINAFRLTSSTDPSTGLPNYIYVMEDDTLSLDDTAWRVTIANTTIWDSSINNATIEDCSIYTSHIEDSSLIRCTLYNTQVDDNTDVDSRDVWVDASIIGVCDITEDTSTYYNKKTRRLDVGLSGLSTDTVISAGDYLNQITDEGLWQKVGEAYMWTSAPDSGVFNEINLINGFYLYNPHTFPISVEYLVIV